MRIQTNISAMQAQFNIGKTNTALSTSMNRLSSGFRITRAADDAAGLAIANKLRTESRALTTASRNVEQANSMLQVAEGGASSVQNILERMKELAVQAASANAGTELDAVDSEFTALKDEITRIVESTNYRGTALVDGTFDGTFQIGASNTTADRLNLALNTGLDTASLGVSGNDLTSQANAQTALASIDDALTTVNEVLGSIGALQNRLDYAQTNIRTSIQNLSAAESVIRDADMAEEMTRFSKNQILSQAGTAMLAQANTLPQGVLQLLRG